ncbi:hypothetical protein NX059_011783 [Plenodomus lindquistii]|nr:hypothetical protein NX059_011783 [Plenodomus lindquistii]
MAPEKKLRVVITGASGETGSFIMDALLSSPDQFNVIALARPESMKKDILQDFARRGASVQPADFQNVDGLVPLLAGADVVISCLTLQQKGAEEALIDASHRAGVGRYIPSFWGTVAPPRGVMWLRDMKEDLLDRCKRLYLPYTVIDVGWWYRATLPRVPSGKLDSAISFPETLIGADGNVEFAGVDVADIGTYVARIIADPRTLNKQVFAYSQVTTQNHIWDTMEALTGETIPRTYLTKEDAEAILAGAKDVDMTDLAAMLKRSLTAYAYSWAIRGDNAPKQATYLGYLLAKDLYPDVKTKGIDDFIREIVQGKGSANYYVGRADHPYNRAKAAATK